MTDRCVLRAGAARMLALGASLTRRCADLDFQNKRGDFVQAFLDHLVSWDFVEKNMHKKGKL